MSDFLRNLRSSHKKDKPNTRQNLDGHYYPQDDRRKLQDRRSMYSESLESFFLSLQDSLPQLVEQNDRLAKAKIRQFESVSTFFDNLNKLFTDDFFRKAAGKRSKATASYASGTHYTKDEIITIIQTMRNDGATFSIIADYLTDKGIPTFSGRGDWHAQTIHRLCK